MGASVTTLTHSFLKQKHDTQLKDSPEKLQNSLRPLHQMPPLPPNPPSSSSLSPSKLDVNFTFNVNKTHNTRTPTSPKHRSKKRRDTPFMHPIPERVSILESVLI